MEGIGINLPLFLAFVVNFVLLFILLSVVLYKPITKMLDARQAKIKESMEQAEAIKQQTATSEQEIKAHLESAQKEVQKIITQATQIGEQLKVEAKEEARQEAENMINKAKVEIQRQREKDIEDLRTQFADIAILAAEKVIKESLDKEKHHRLIEDVLRNNPKLKQN